MNLQYKNNFWGYFNFYYRIVGGRIFTFLLLSIVISLLDGLGLAMFIPLLQAVGSRPEASSRHPLGQLHYITDFIQFLGFDLSVSIVLITLVILFILKGIFKYFQLTFYARLRHMFIKRIRYHLLDKLQGLSYTGFLKLDAGNIQNTITGEVARLFTTMSYYFNAAQSFVMLITYMLLAMLANLQFALLVAIGGALSNLVYKKVYVSTKRTSIELSKKASDFTSFGMQVIHYFKYLKSTNTFGPYVSKLKNVINQTENLHQRIGYMNAITASVKEPIIVIIVALVITFQLNIIGTSINIIILSLLLFYRALSFLVTVQNHWQGFIEHIGGMNAVAVMGKEMCHLQEEFGSREFKSIQTALSIKNVDFYYQDIKVLHGLNIEIPKKSTVALIGESGSGKTTVANMIAGLIKPQSGEINIDNISLHEFDLNKYRSKIGYISQESVVFNDTIFNNITFWADPTPANIARFNEILAISSLEEFVRAQPEREFTRLGDNGIFISGGQKQRISIARELYKEAQILIFDEATSALDSETEKMIQQNIERLHGYYTMIIIAHRLSTIKDADIIFLLEKGKVSASGTFGEMIRTSARFKKMVSLQGFS